MYARSPVQFTISHFAILTNFCEMIIVIFNDSALFEEVVLPALHDALEDEVDNEEHRCPVHASWVYFISCAKWAKSREKGQSECQCVQGVHDLEIQASFLLDCSTGRAFQIV